MTRVAIVVVAMMGLSISLPARADDLALARKHYEAGKKLQKKRNHIGAIAEFEQARSLVERPNILFNLGLEHDALAQAGDDAHVAPAIDSFRRYLVLEPKADDRADVEARIAELESRRVTITERERVRQAAEAETERRKAAEAEQARRAVEKAERERDAAERQRKAVEAAEQRRAVAAQAQRAAERAEQERRVAEAEATRLIDEKKEQERAAAQAAKPEQAAASPVGAASARMTWGKALIATGALVAAAGLGLSIGAAVQESNAQSAHVLDDWYSRYGTADSLRLGGGIALGAGAAILLGGVVLAVLPAREHATSLWVSPAAGGLVVGGVF